ncbi:MAG: ABC transporter permease, partial [Oscillospiraceae bacterium]|nr:ABC transporter permease [Oscillospiraceae bacterium]
IAGRFFLGGMNPWLASALTLMICACLGAGIGTVVTKIKLSHFVVTLAVMQMARGVTMILTRGTPLSLLTLPDEFKFIGQGSIGPVPFFVILFVIIAVVADYMVRNSSIMRQVFFVGSNEKAAKYSGIRVDRIKIGAAVFTSTMAGLAGIINMARFNTATPGIGIGLELTIFAACVIGGNSMNGGKGTVLGAVLGMILMTFITTSMTLLRVSPHWQDLVRGAILLAAVSFDQISQMRKNGTGPKWLSIKAR